MFVILSGISALSSCGASAATPASTTITATPSHSQSPVIAQPFSTTLKTFDGSFSLTLTITPNRSGPNQFAVLVMDSHSSKPADHIIVTLYTTMQDMPMGTDSLELHAEGDGRFSATSNILNMGGHWAIGITIQTADHVVHEAGVNLITSA